MSFFVCPSCSKTLQAIPVRTVTDSDWESINARNGAPITRPAMAESITSNPIDVVWNKDRIEYLSISAPITKVAKHSEFFQVRFAFEDALRTNGIRLTGPVVIALDAMVEALAVSGQKPRTSKSNVHSGSTLDSKVGE